MRPNVGTIHIQKIIRVGYPHKISKYGVNIDKICYNELLETLNALLISVSLAQQVIYILCIFQSFFSNSKSISKIGLPYKFIEHRSVPSPLNFIIIFDRFIHFPPHKSALFLFCNFLHYLFFQIFFGSL